PTAGTKSSPYRDMEVQMPDLSSMHPYLDWTKQRIDEMDAALASLEAKVPDVIGELRGKAEECLAMLKKQRNEFQAQATVQAEVGEAALRALKAQLETQWEKFEADLNAYFATF